MTDDNPYDSWEEYDAYIYRELHEFLDDELRDHVDEEGQELLDGLCEDLQALESTAARASDWEDSWAGSYEPDPPSLWDTLLPWR